MTEITAEGSSLIVNHTKGDSLNEVFGVTQTIEGEKVPVQWSSLGIVSAKSQIKKKAKDEEAVAEIDIDISIDGQIGFYCSSESLDISAKTYIFDVQFTKENNDIETWFPNSKLVIQQDTTQ